jgi:hypothetical protein
METFSSCSRSRLLFLENVCHKIFFQNGFEILCYFDFRQWLDLSKGAFNNWRWWSGVETLPPN